MSCHWVIATIPGWIASKLVHNKDTSMVHSSREITFYTDNTVRFTCIDAYSSSSSYYIHLHKKTQCKLTTHDGYEFDSTIYSIEHIPVNETSAILKSRSSSFWTIHLGEQTLEVHQFRGDDDAIIWTIEGMWTTTDPKHVHNAILKQISS